MCVLHLDVDAFFAAIEQRDQPRLRGRPVAVGTGVVASCSYEARPFGVRTGMRLVDARGLCPQLIVLPGDYRRYEIAGRQILGICHAHTSQVEMAALDDLYLDLHPRSLEQAATLGRALARQIRDEVGLRVSLGLGANKLVAAVATQEVKERKARGLCTSQEDLAVVAEGHEREYLARWPVEVLPGVGAKASEQLARLNVRRVEELAVMPASLLAGLFGSRGLLMRQYALGVDHRVVVPTRESQSVSRCTSFEPALGEWMVISAMLDHLVERAAWWLRLNQLATRGLLVRVRYADQRSSESRASLDRPSQDDVLLRRVARERLQRAYTRRLPLRLVGVEMAPLQGPEQQGELFVDEEQERQKRLCACKDEIRKRHGFMAVTSGTALELQGKVEHDRDNYRLRTPCLTR